MVFKVLFGGEVPMFHHRLVELRKSKKITQEALAIKIGVTRSALSQYELGLRQPDYEIVKNMADYFNVTTDDLLGRETKESSIVETELDRKKRKGLEYISRIKDDKTLDLAIELLEKLSRD